jgi:hypothetical protein
MNTEFTEITEAMIGSGKKEGACSTIADLMILGEMDQLGRKTVSQATPSSGTRTSSRASGDHDCQH